MKTDKFENTIRRKLESIAPEFHENDWTKMQNFMQANTPPTFWQQYSSWFGYAAAAAVSSVMVFLYVNQLSQNNTLLSDVKALQNQIEAIKNVPAVTTPTIIQKTDTVYVVQQQVIEKPVYDHRASDQEEEKYFNQQRRNQESVANAEGNEVNKEGNETDPGVKIGENQLANSSSADEINVTAGKDHLEHNPVTGKSDASSVKSSEYVTGKKFLNNNADLAVAANGKSVSKNGNSYSSAKGTNNSGSVNTGRNSGLNGGGNSGNGNSFANSTSGYQGNISIVSAKTLDGKFDQLEIQSPVGQTNYAAISRKMNYGLVHRISPRQIRNVLLAANPPKIVEEAKNVESTKKVESSKKAETAIPKFNLKVPYRFGIAQQWEGKNQVKTVLGEVLISKNFSVSTGFSWVKIKPEDFYSETVYNQKNRTDFRKDHLVPMALKISNLNINSSLKQIPLNITFRQNLPQNFAYFVGAGTNFTVASKRDITYECVYNFGPRPGADQYQTIQQASEKINLKLFNSVNFSAGIEKSFHPVVVQAEGYLYSYFNPVSPQATKSGPGFKIKLLYQIGKKM